MHDDLTDFLFNELSDGDMEPGIRAAVYETVREHLERCYASQYWPSASHYCFTCGCELKGQGCYNKFCLNCDYRAGK
jgi:hypothetical protein